MLIVIKDSFVHLSGFSIDIKNKFVAYKTNYNPCFLVV